MKLLSARELRIGNLVEYKITDKFDERKEWWEVCEIDADDIHWLSKVDIYDDNFKPIPLTEECLLKFGFKHIRNNWYNIHAGGNTFNVYLFDEIGYRVEIVNQSIAVLKYLHQLQNIYFCLCGKELIINN